MRLFGREPSMEGFSFTLGTEGRRSTGQGGARAAWLGSPPSLPGEPAPPGRRTYWGRAPNLGMGRLREQPRPAEMPALGAAALGRRDRVPPTRVWFPPEAIPAGVVPPWCRPHRCRYDPAPPCGPRRPGQPEGAGQSPGWGTEATLAASGPEPHAHPGNGQTSQERRAGPRRCGAFLCPESPWQA